MAIRGKSFSIDTDGLDRVLTTIRKERERADRLTIRKMSQAVDIVYRVAHARRPMISKTQMKAQGRTSRVSDPNAEAGVPVRTGALQVSIQKKVTQEGEKTVGRIWTNSPYAAYMEFGTSRVQARPFMRPAINLTKDALKAIFAKKDAGTS